MTMTLTSYAILVPPFSTGHCCLLISPATALTETVEGVRSYVTWKLSVVYYPHVTSMPILTYEIAFLTVLCCVYNNRDGQVSSTVLAYYDTRNLQRAIERKGIKRRHISIQQCVSNPQRTQCSTHAAISVGGVAALDLLLQHMRTAYLTFCSAGNDLFIQFFISCTAK